MILGNNPGRLRLPPPPPAARRPAAPRPGRHLETSRGGVGDDILVGDYFSNRLGGRRRPRPAHRRGDANYIFFNADDLDGGAGEDIVIGGFTDYDATDEAWRRSGRRGRRRGLHDPGQQPVERHRRAAAGRDHGALQLRPQHAARRRGIFIPPGLLTRDFFFSDPYGYDMLPDRSHCEVLVEIV